MRQCGEGAGGTEKDQAGEQLRLPALLGVINRGEQVCTQMADPESSDLFLSHRRSLSAHAVKLPLFSACLKSVWHRRMWHVCVCVSSLLPNNKRNKMFQLSFSHCETGKSFRLPVWHFWVICRICIIENLFPCFWRLNDDGYSCNTIDPNLFVFFFSSTSPLRLTPSDARTVSFIMPDTRSGATPLLIMALLRLLQAQEVPLIPGKTLPIHLHWSVSSSSTITSWSGSYTCFVHPSVCGTVWLLWAWRLSLWGNESFYVWAAAPFDCGPDRQHCNEESVASED